MFRGNWKFRIRHVIENIERIQGFVRGMSYSAFCEDEKTVYAVVCAFSVIGEAARLVPEEVKKSYPKVPWNSMTRMRNALVHEYDRIDLQIVWGTIHEDLPLVVPLLEKILHQPSAD